MAIETSNLAATYGPVLFSMGFSINSEMLADDVYFPEGLQKWIEDMRQRYEDDILASNLPDLFEWHDVHVGGVLVETVRVHKESGRTRTIDHRPPEDEDECCDCCCHEDDE